ncbi:extracellular solute-binding protein [Oceanobacillus sp. 143]|nr:extracellular solute-binding protein [Oceanobacillus sp. 143]
MKSNKWLIVLMSVLLATILAACSGNSGEAGGGGSDDKDIVSFWAPFSGDDGPFMKKIVDDYNESQDEFTVNLQIEPNADYYRNVDLAINDGKNTPDVMIMHNEQILSYAEKGLLREVSDIVDGELTDVYHESGIQGATVGDKVYGLPLDIHSLLFYWNKDMFEAAGLDPEQPPTTREEFIDYAQKLTDLDNNQYGFVVPTLWPQDFILPTIVAQNGGKLYEDGKANFASDAVVEALQFQLDLIEKYKVSPTDVQADGEVTLFLQGKNAMHLNGPWMLAQWESSNLDYGVAAVPQLGTEVQSVFAKSHNFVVLESTNEEKLPAITDFLKYVSEMD